MRTFKLYLMFPFFFVGLCVATLWLADLFTTLPPSPTLTWEECVTYNLVCA